MTQEPYLGWNYCIDRLKAELTSQQFNTWILPLQVSAERNLIKLYAPNRFVMDWVKKNYVGLINSYLEDFYTNNCVTAKVEIGSNERPIIEPFSSFFGASCTSATVVSTESKDNVFIDCNLRSEFTFSNFVEGKSNQLARAASIQIAENPGTMYNPLFVYGGVGLGKTHLLHAIGNGILQQHPEYKVIYQYANSFVNDMVKALQNGTISQFKQKYAGVNALLIDDVQFFAGKGKTQEEFFHTFNLLFESQQQIVLTCDRYPKEVNLEERLQSRFGWGLVVRIEPPDLETRVAILQKKAIELFGTELPNEVAFFISKRFHSNIRDIEGALKRLIASTRFTGQVISIESARLALKDMLAVQDKQITIENIQKMVVEYFNIRPSDLTSSNRSRNIARPRQIAMSLAKELTNLSLPEIGKHFGGRDHTTVLYAVRKIDELRGEDGKVDEDFNHLLRTLTC